MSSFGLFLWLRRPLYGSELSRLHVLLRSLANCTALSARPLLCGYPGLLVMCLNPQVLEKFLNWNIGSHCAKWLLSLSMTVVYVVLVIELNP